MKRIALLTALISFTVLCQSCRKIVEGEGQISSDIRQTKLFKKIQINGSGEFQIIHATNPSIKINGYANLLPLYTTTVKNETLILEYLPSYTIRNSNMKVWIDADQISEVIINGDASVTMSGFSNQPVLNTTINGSGKLKLNYLTYGKMGFTINGSGYIAADTSPSIDAEAKIKGSGNILLNCMQNLKVRIDGSGLVSYYGNPPNTDISISGSGIAQKM